MEHELTLQEMFDMQCEFDAPRIALLNSFNQLWEKYSADAEKGKMSLSYYKELKELSDKHGLSYTEPMYRGGLKEVGTSPTLH